MRVLVACEYSGIVRDAFERRGHYAVSADYLETETPGRHYKGDARRLFNEGWDLMIAHPPCTRLCNSGVRWIEERGLYEDVIDGAQLFLDFINAPIERICVENPIPHGYAKKLIGRPTQYIQPYMFGDKITKKTGLWLKGLNKLQSTKRVRPLTDVLRIPPSENRWKERSRFYPGVAEAMAKQFEIGILL